MYAFSYWHTYYDSAFCSLPFKIPNILYSDLQISLQPQKWPMLSFLPQLSRLFELFEDSILTQDNWVGCVLSEKEMEEVESQINLLIVNLQCEKIYGSQFWQKYPRRVQSSIVHFSIYFKIFISSLIPDDCDCLLEAKGKEKLPFSFKKLEDLVNSILANLKFLHRFLFQSAFTQQSNLVKQFLSDFLFLLQNLPNISKQKLFQTCKLMEFIAITNPLETDQHQSSQSASSVRRKNLTAADNKRLKQKRRSEEKSNKSSQRSLTISNKTIFKSKSRKASLDQIKISFSPPKELAKVIKIFKLNEKVRKHSFYRNVKKHTVTSYETKDKTASIEKQRSGTNQRSLSFNDQYQMRRTETLPTGRPKQQSFYVQKRSREGSSKSIRDKSQSRAIGYEREEAEYERLIKTKKKKGTKTAIRTMPVSNILELGSGKCRGWGFVRQWFKTRLATRKLKELQKQF